MGFRRKRACTGFFGTCITQRPLNVEPEFPRHIATRRRRDVPHLGRGGHYRPREPFIVDGKTFVQPLTVTMDPRVKALANQLREQFDLSWRLYQLRLKLAPIGEKFEDLAQQLTKLKRALPSALDATQKLEGLHSDTSSVWAAASAARRSTFVFRLGINDAAARRRSGRRCCANSGDKGRRRG